jgi:hypothetical protein
MQPYLQERATASSLMGLKVKLSAAIKLIGDEVILPLHSKCETTGVRQTVYIQTGRVKTFFLPVSQRNWQWQ